MAEVKKPSDLPKAKKHKPMDSDEDDGEPQNDWNFFKHSAHCTSATSPATTNCQLTRTSANCEDEHMRTKTTSVEM